MTVPVFVERGMSRRILQACAGVLVAISVSACEMTKSEHPLGPTVAGPIPGVNITPPTPLEPAQGFRIAVDSQPVTLTLSNAATTGVRPLNYLFEVATDAGFSNKVFSRDGIMPGASGRTTLRLPNALAPERSYYWRARAQDGANTGPYSSAAFFNVFTPVVLGKPILQEPVGNATAASLQPTLKFANAPRSGPAGAITYEIQLAENEAFSPAVGIWSVGRDAGPDVPRGAGAAHSRQTVLLARSRIRRRRSTGPWSDIAAFKAPATPAAAVVAAVAAVETAPLATFPRDQRRCRARNRSCWGLARSSRALLPRVRARRPALQLMLRMIWHLRLAGFQAGTAEKSVGCNFRVTSSRCLRTGLACL